VLTQGNLHGTLQEALQLFKLPSGGRQQPAGRPLPQSLSPGMTGQRAWQPAAAAPWLTGVPRPRPQGAASSAGHDLGLDALLAQEAINLEIVQPRMST